MPPKVFSEKTATDFQRTKLLVPVDFSEPSPRAIAYARTFYQRFGLVIHLLHVDEPAPLIAGIDAAPLHVDEPTELSHLEREWVELAEDVPAGARGRIRVREGSATEEFISVANELRIDLMTIPIPTHGHSGVHRVLFGSTAEEVVREAPCSVLVMRPGRCELVVRHAHGPVFVAKERVGQ